jgi:hypothetical protein
MQQAEQSDPVVETTLATGSDGMVDVVMRRETATFRVPVSQATLPATLLSAAGVIESGAASTVAIASGARLPAQVQPEAAADLMQPIAAIARAIEDASIDLDEALEGDEANLLDDMDSESAARLAGRLRPALPVA